VRDFAQKIGVGTGMMR